MTTQYSEVRDSIEVPKNSGIPGFLRALEDILRLPRLQELAVNAKGLVSFRYFLREGEQKKAVEVDFETLLPYAVVRNSEVRELVDVDENAAVAIGQLFDGASTDHLFPAVFVGAPDCRIWSWYEQTTGIELGSHEHLYGVPFVADRNFENHVLILCAAFMRSADLINTQRSYKLVIPEVKA